MSHRPSVPRIADRCLFPCRLIVDAKLRLLKALKKRALRKRNSKKRHFIIDEAGVGDQPFFHTFCPHKNFVHRQIFV
uniref:Transposase n=1 Tax=Globodera rostochiensis TaxID=31243 RepID=A0A914H5M6_GLORO